MCRSFFMMLLFLLLSGCKAPADSNPRHEANDTVTTHKSIQNDQPIIARLIQQTESEIFFTDTTEEDKICSQHLNYLGEFKNENGETTFKIITILTE